MVTSRGLTSAATVVACFLAEVPKGVDRISELKLRLQMWETGQASELISKIPQTDEQREKP